MLEEFERIHPGSAAMILKMATSQSEHRHHIERVVIESSARLSDRGLHYGFVVVLATLTAGVWLVSSGYPNHGAIVLGTQIPALAGVFVYGRRTQVSELLRKR